MSKHPYPKTLAELSKARDDIANAVIRFATAYDSDPPELTEDELAVHGENVCHEAIEDAREVALDMIVTWRAWRHR